jgi:glutamate dehydrogenase (NAD(P)+)
MEPDVSVEECVRLARAMTFKNAAAGLPHGGGKSVIFADPYMADDDKERLIRAFACAIGDIKDYIVGPDMGTNERCMAWVQDEIGRSVGLPLDIGGIPLDDIGATGFGVAIAAEVAQDFCDVELQGARVAIQGFGAVGKHAARFLSEKGCVLVAASDSKGTLVDASGIDVQKLIDLKEAGKKVCDAHGGEKLDVDAIISVECDILIPAARPDVLNADNAGDIQAKMVVQGANIPATLEAESIMHERGILSIPDFIANAGGVICASVEYHGGTQSAALDSIDEKLRRNTRQMLEAASQSGVAPREAAMSFAAERVKRAMGLRRWS